MAAWGIELVLSMLTVDMNDYASVYRDGNENRCDGISWMLLLPSSRGGRTSLETDTTATALPAKYI